MEFNLKIYDRATPAKEACDKVSLIAEYRLRTIKVPINGQIIDMKIPVIKAFLINSYLNKIYNLLLLKIFYLHTLLINFYHVQRQVLSYFVHLILLS